jgi:hypothetical protein
MRKPSESQCRTKLILSGASSLSNEELYRAAVYSANSGTMIKEAAVLDVNERLLLEVRIMLSSGELDRAKNILSSLKIDDLALNLQADVEFLLGQHSFRIGNLDSYFRHMHVAKLLYSNAGDSYRALRAQINVEVIRAEKDSFECGNLKALYQEARRQQAFDLAGNIAKGEAIECVKRGEIKKALTFGLLALENYESDGCPEDQSLTNVVTAIIYFILGDFKNAQLHADRASIKHGKVKFYFEIWQSLQAGSIPQVPATHAFANIAWEPLLRKKSSITQKIVSALREQPLTKVEIIERVWGTDAGGPSYEARFFSALQQLKKQKQLIIFDGEKYRVA